MPQRMMNQASWFQEISCFGGRITRHIIPDYSPNFNMCLWIGLVDRRSLATTNTNIRMSHWPKGIKAVDWWMAGPQKRDAAALCWMGMQLRACQGSCPVSKEILFTERSVWDFVLARAMHMCPVRNDMYRNLKSYCGAVRFARWHIDTTSSH